MPASKSTTSYTTQIQSELDKEAVYVHPNFKDNVDCNVSESNFTTLYDGFYHGWERAKKYGDCRLLGHRKNGEGPYKWIDYKQVEATCTAISSRLASLGLNKGSMVGIYSRTRMEWMLTFIACQFRSFIAIPLYDTLGNDALLHILYQTELQVVVVSMISEAKTLMKIRDSTCKIKYIFVIEWPKEEVDGKDAVEDWEKYVNDEIIPNGVECDSYDNCVLQGQKSPMPHDPPEPRDVFEICYTSGTTGKPKGAVYRHDCMISEIHSLKRYVKRYLHDTTFEVTLCYLPLAHSYELAVECFCVMYGFKLGYFNGNPRKILDDIQVLQPTILAAVPRVLSRIHQGIEQKTSRREAGLVRSLLFRLALRNKMAAMENGQLQETVVDKLFFKQLHKLLGGKLKIVFVGSSSTHPRTLKMLRATLGCHICEGYGQTETYGISFVQQPNDTSLGCIGAPLDILQFKVVDIPDLNYYSSKNEGELCIKGSSTIDEYYKDPDQTAKLIDSDGWLHTGDVAKVNANGTLSLIDRLKDFFKLAQGEYVIPEKVESAYKQCNEIENILVFGDSLKTCCVAVIFPDFEAFQASLKKAKIPFDKSNYNKSKQVKEYLLRVMERAAVENELKGFEKAKNIFISSLPAVDYPDLLTPTMKFKRHSCFKYFEREIGLMYDGIVEKPF